MPLDARRLWRSIWKKSGGNLVEAGQVAAFGRRQCAKARNPLTLVGLEKHYSHWRSGLAQVLPELEDAEDNDAFIAREIAQRGSR